MDALTGDRTGTALILILVVAVVMVAVAAFFFVKLLGKYRAVHGQFAPMGAKVAFWAALAYTVLPVDFLPDPLLFDDIGVLVAAYTYINHLLNQRGAVEELE